MNEKLKKDLSIAIAGVLLESNSDPDEKLVALYEITGYYLMELPKAKAFGRRIQEYIEDRNKTPGEIT